MDPDVLRPLLAAIGRAVVLTASVSWPLIALGVAAVTALALWALFRRGSIADRARADYDDEADAGPGASGSVRD